MADETIPPPEGTVPARSRRAGERLAAGRRGIARQYDKLMAWRLPGLPPGLGTIEWLLAASFRMPGASVAALGAAWTAVIVALWAAMFDAIGSVVVAVFGISFSGHFAGIVNFSSHTAGGLAFLGAIASAAVGFAAGFTATYANSFGHAVPVVAAALFVGMLQGLVIALVVTAMEPTLLRWRGYRRPSRREWELHLGDAMQTVVDAMKLRETPKLLIMDTPVPQAWTHARTIVLSKGLIEGLDAAELAGVLAHEMVHWQQGDGLANRMVWAFGWPIAVLYSLGMFLSGNRFGPQAREGLVAAGAGGVPGTHVNARSVVKAGTTVLALIGWLFLWPAYLLTRFVMVPVAAAETRLIEYQADAGAAAVGLGGGLQRALERIAPWEAGRTAWEAALAATHPPIELRIEALEDAEYKPPSPVEPIARAESRTTWGILVTLLVVALTPLVPTAHHAHNGWWWHW